MSSDYTHSVTSLVLRDSKLQLDRLKPRYVSGWTWSSTRPSWPASPWSSWRDGSWTARPHNWRIHGTSWPAASVTRVAGGPGPRTGCGCWDGAGPHDPTNTSSRRRSSSTCNATGSHGRTRRWWRWWWVRWRRISTTAGGQPPVTHTTRLAISRCSFVQLPKKTKFRSRRKVHSS